MKTKLDITDICDSANCEHEVDVWHVRGAGVFCDECAARRIKLAWDEDEERAEQHAAREDAMKNVPQVAPAE